MDMKDVRGQSPIATVGRSPTPVWVGHDMGRRGYCPDEMVSVE
jgi:hypothetical protein